MPTYRFRNSAPSRSYTGPVLTPYRKYKPFLANDFLRRCGYTDCPDFWFGGIKAFHIDHFKPKSKPDYAHLECAYSNLVYACSHVNQAKGDDDADYLDPCTVDYNQHFERDEDGNITPIEGSQRADYMYIRLKLYLRRYGIIWTLEALREKLRELRGLLERVTDQQIRNELLEQHYRLSSKFEDYLSYLAANQ